MFLLKNNKISLSSNDGEIMQTVDSIKAYEWERGKT